MKMLEIGPTPNTKIGDDWDTMDIVDDYNPTYVHDIKEPMIMIPNNTYDIVYASHIMEHVPWYKSDEVFRELHRILKPKGTLEIWVPDFGKIIEVYHTQKMPDNWRMMNSEHNPMKWVLGRLFAYDRNGTNDHNFHRNAFDKDSLEKAFKSNGFKNTKLLDKTRTVDHGWVNLGMVGEK